MAKVLLDIGAHVGETARVALQPRWAFDRVYSFEPSPECWDALDSIADPRLVIARFGLWARDSVLPLYNSGSIGASVHKEKEPRGAVVQAEFRDAAAWLRASVSEQDTVVVKMNCEGAEVEIIDRLIDTGEIRKIQHLLVHFDIAKVPGQGMALRELQRRLDASGVDFRSAESMFFGRNISEKTVNWLTWLHAGRLGRLRHTVVRRVEYTIRVRLYTLRVARRSTGQSQ